MPTYLLHGFRWPRPLIRIHIILQNIDDAAAEWLMAPQTGQALTTNLTSLYPELIPALPNLRFIEQYDPLDDESKSQPYAYVADTVYEVKLGVDVDEVRGRGIDNKAWTSMVELRDNLAPGAKVAWYVVVCGDVERWAPPTQAAIEESIGNGYQNGFQFPLNGGSASSFTSYDKRSSGEQANSRPNTSRGLKKFFSMRSLRKSKSMKSINTARQSSEASSPPPLPTSPMFPPSSQHSNNGVPTLNGHHPPPSNGYAPRSPPSVPGVAL